MIFFDTVVKRVANFSVQSYEINKENIFEFFNKEELFQLCILNASVSLYSDITKKKSEKTEISLGNYFARAHFNPTPFGIFNSVGVLNWGNNTSIPKTKTLHLKVKYDNLFLSSKKLELNDKQQWFQSNYGLNPTIYFLNEQKISFYKSKNDKNNNIKISYAELDVDDNLLWLLDQFKNGNAIKSVAENLVSDGFDEAEVMSFLYEVVESGLIIDTFLFDNFTGKLYGLYPLFESQLIKQKEHFLEKEIEIRNFKNTILKEQDVLFGNCKPKDFYAINTFDAAGGTLSKDVQEKIKKFVDFSLHYNSTTLINEKLNQFFSKVQSRFNEGFISLNTLFNPHSGISYSNIKANNDSKLHSDILTKILVSTGENLYLNLLAEDTIEVKRKKTPATFSVVLENLISKDTGEEIVYFHGLGDSSALGFIARFSDVTEKLCKEVVKYEKDVNKDKIVAEINCVGNFRSINLSSVEQSYDSYIPVNTTYSEDDNVILLSDIYIHHSNNNFSLISKKHQKEILPKKASSVNPRLLESDVYNFLCDYEFYNQEINSVNFDFNALNLHLPYVPRIFLEEGVLLYPAQLLLVYNNYTIEEFEIYLENKIATYSFSKKILIVDNYGKTIFDLENPKKIIALFEKLKASKIVYVTEWLYDFYKPAVSLENENFAHEIIVGVKNPYYSRSAWQYNKMEILPFESHNTAVVSDWLYLELFCNTHADGEIFNVVYDILLKEQSDLFFFINYANPERHLRLRFKTNSLENKQDIIKKIHELKSNNIISKYQILPYEPEVYRYGGTEIMEFSQVIFDLDTRDLLNHIVNDNNNLSQKDLYIIAILKMKNYLTFLNFSLDEMLLVCESFVKSYAEEFEFTAELRKDFNKQFNTLKIEIEQYDYFNFLEKASFQNSLLDKLKKSDLKKDEYAWLLIHMSMNRHFKEEQRFNEFKIYFMTKCYLNQLKFKYN